MLLRLENSYLSMAANMRHLERIANNVANANTVGYRKDRYFTEVLNEEIDDEGSPRSTRSISQWADHRPGSLERTANPFDVALEGEGFFVVTDPQTGAQLYTRAGQFLQDEDGVLRNSEGHIVEGQNGPIVIPPNAENIEIHRNGDLFVDKHLIATFRVVQFPNLATLERIEGASFAASDQTLSEVEDPLIRQGHLEMSNVNAIEAMTDLISNSRLFETQQRALRTIDLQLQRVTRELARF